MLLLSDLESNICLNRTVDLMITVKFALGYLSDFIVLLHDSMWAQSLTEVGSSHYAYFLSVMVTADSGF